MKTCSAGYSGEVMALASLQRPIVWHKSGVQGYDVGADLSRKMDRLLMHVKKAKDVGRRVCASAR